MPDISKMLLMISWSVKMLQVIKVKQEYFVLIDVWLLVIKATQQHLDGDELSAK